MARLYYRQEGEDRPSRKSPPPAPTNYKVAFYISLAINLLIILSLSKVIH